jgi:signal transduction histidine kinase
LLAVRTAWGETILVGRDISQIGELHNRLLLMLVLSGAVILLSVSATAVALSVKPLRRVRDLQMAACQISAGRLDARMPIAGKGDELDQFAGTVNGMVEEVGRVISQVKGVTDAVAHDLRTPLTRLRTHLHRARRVPDMPQALASLVDQSVAELDLVLERFTALLRIAELEASGRRKGFEIVDLAQLVANARELFEPLAEERGITLTFGTVVSARIRADEKLMFEAVSNLIDNAIKFAPEGGHVEISVRQNVEAVTVDVRDDGPGIPPDQRAAVLRRFHRGSDVGSIPGSGLGLSVVAAIIHLHGFSLDFEDAGPGLIARITMPG